MIYQKSIDFLYDLRENNSKEWFDTNRKRYEQARSNFIEVTKAIIIGIESYDEGVAQTELDPKKTMMRINRDIRFSRDKTPYNSHLFTSINEGGKKNPTAGYFFSLDPGKSFYGAGAYKPPSDVLNQMRQEIDFSQEEWKRIVSDTALKASFGEVVSSDQLSRPPKGYEKDHPRIEWIKRKDFFVQKSLSDEALLSNDLVDTIVNNLRNSHTLVSFLNRR